MSLFSGPEQHAANPPSTWQVVKAAERAWQIRTASGDVLAWSMPTRREALARLADGPEVNLYERERRWYAGETIRGWKPWAQCLAERERNRRRFEIGRIT